MNGRTPSERLKDDLEALELEASEHGKEYSKNIRAILEELDQEWKMRGRELEILLVKRKDKTGILYRDKDISLSRSISGVVSMYCPSPVEVWHSSNGGACISVPVFEERGGGMDQRGRKLPRGYKRPKD